MTEIAGLFLILIAIYVSECVVWTRPGDWIFYGWRKKRWRVVRDPQFMIGDYGGLTIVGIVPPLPVHMLIPNSEKALNAEKSNLAEMKDPSLDIRSLIKRMKKFEEESLIVKFAGNLLFLMIFLVLPAILWTGTIKIYWPPLLIVFLYLWLLGISGFFIAHRRLFRDQKAQRLKRTLLIGLSPLSTIRAANQLGKDLVHDLNPITVCYWLCSEADFEHNARTTYYDLMKAQSAGTDDTQLDVSHSPKTANIFPLTAFLRSTGHLECLFDAPVRENSCSASYCPRCHCQYRAGFDTCIDCDNILLIPFDRTAELGKA